MEMGGTESSEKSIESTSELAVATGCQRSNFLRDLAGSHVLEKQDFYELFGLDRYCDMDNTANKHKMREEYKSLLLACHPDKNSSEHKQLCELLVAKIFLAKNVLQDAKLKRRYDKELRKQREEESGWSTCTWWLRWGLNLALILGGPALIGVGMVGTAITGGTSIALSVLGSCVLCAGIKGSSAMVSDPDCSLAEFSKGIAVGTVAGGIGGIIAAAGGLQLAACTYALQQLGISAGIGGLTTGMARIISDACDIAITEGFMGTSAKTLIISAKTKEEVFSKENTVQLVISILFGAAAGSGLHAIMTDVSCVADAPDAADVTDDVAQLFSQVGQHGAGSMTEGSVISAVDSITGAVKSSEALITVEITVIDDRFPPEQGWPSLFCKVQCCLAICFSKALVLNKRISLFA